MSFELSAGAVFDFKKEILAGIIVLVSTLNQGSRKNIAVPFIHNGYVNGT